MWTAERARRGSALLAVLWISAALAAIAFSLASTVRGEIERTSTEVDGLRSYYLASGGILRAEWELLWTTQDPNKPLIPKRSTHVDYNFPSGTVHVEIIPEAAKLDVNTASPEQLYRLLAALGASPDRAREIALAIADWRAPSPAGGLSEFDQYYSSLTPTFHAPHTSFGEIEELLLVKGVTPDIFYGTYVPAAENGSGAAGGPRLAPRQGLMDCLTVFGSGGLVDANTASPAVLAAVGVPPEIVDRLVAQRNVTPFSDETLNQFLQSMGAPPVPLRVEGYSIITMRATARVRLPDGRLSDLKRTVGAQVKYMPPGYDSPIHILRWYDTMWGN